MAQAKIVTEQELKRALSILRDRRHADRDRLALLLTHWAGTESALLIPRDDARPGLMLLVMSLPFDQT